MRCGAQVPGQPEQGDCLGGAPVWRPDADAPAAVHRDQRAQERCICLGPREAFEAAAQTAPTRKTLLGGLLNAGPAPVATPRSTAARQSSAALAAGVVARMAALNPVRYDLDTTTPIEQAEISTAGGPRIAIGKPGRGKVAAALGI